jgi:hypothetical protein
VKYPEKRSNYRRYLNAKWKWAMLAGLQMYI